LHGGEVEPGALAPDEPAPEVEDVQKADLDRAPASVEPEGPPDRRGVQDRLVDDVVVAVPAANRLERSMRSSPNRSP